MTSRRGHHHQFSKRRQSTMTAAAVLSTFALISSDRISMTSAQTTQATPSDTSCKDNPFYRNKLGMTCSYHATLDCNDDVNYSDVELKQLRTECPASCRVERCAEMEEKVEGDGQDTFSSAGMPPKYQLNNVNEEPPEPAATEESCHEGWDPTCRDDPTYFRFGVSCYAYAGVDCGFFRFAGYTVTEVDELITQCPCSCGIECSLWATRPTKMKRNDRTDSPTMLPTVGPTTGVPTAISTVLPTTIPTAAPTKTPTTAIPTSTPTVSHSNGPSASPTKLPTAVPTLTHSNVPSAAPTKTPTTTTPTLTHSLHPSTIPTAKPTASHSDHPSAIPTMHPTVAYSSSPSATPTIRPTNTPSSSPTKGHSSTPSISASSKPSNVPSEVHSSSPSITKEPTSEPSSVPTLVHSSSPSSIPTTTKTSSPSISASPSDQPSSTPTSGPSGRPAGVPSSTPSASPTLAHSSVPSSSPTSSPSAHPSSSPTSQPSLSPTVQPSSSPTASPSAQPSPVPTVHLSSLPSALPTKIPIAPPSVVPTEAPTAPPSVVTTEVPTTTPPTESPSHVQSASQAPTANINNIKFVVDAKIMDDIPSSQERNSNNNGIFGLQGWASIGLFVGCGCAILATILAVYVIHRRRRRRYSSSYDGINAAPSAEELSAAAARIKASCQQKATSVKQTKKQRLESKSSAASASASVSVSGSQTPAQRRAALEKSMFIQTQPSMTDDIDDGERSVATEVILLDLQDPLARHRSEPTGSRSITSELIRSHGIAAESDAKRSKPRSTRGGLLGALFAFDTEDIPQTPTNEQNEEFTMTSKEYGDNDEEERERERRQKERERRRQQAKATMPFDVVAIPSPSSKSSNRGSPEWGKPPSVDSEEEEEVTLKGIAITKTMSCVTLPAGLSIVGALSKELEGRNSETLQNHVSSPAHEVSSRRRRQGGSSRR